MLLMRTLSAFRPDCLYLQNTPVRLPGFVPAVTGVTPLDRMLAPYLPRVSPLGQLVSYPSFFVYHGQPSPLAPRTWIDGGSWGVLRRAGGWRVRPDGTAVVELTYPEDRRIVVSPEELLKTQQTYAAVGFTLDIPVPPDCSQQEAFARLRASVENARFAVCNCSHPRNFLLYASLPFVDDTRELFNAIDEVIAFPIDGVALGGMALRRQDWNVCLGCLAQIRRRIGRLPLHVFGIGDIQRVRQAWEAGADTVDSSAPLRLALSGRLVGTQKMGMIHPSAVERLHLALVNIARFATLPLGMDLASFLISSPFVRFTQPMNTPMDESCMPDIEDEIE